jgi:hypothetical protein
MSVRSNTSRPYGGHAERKATSIGICGFVDSTIGHIDGQYLFAQVALEAMVERLSSEKKPIVKNVAAWKAWTKSLRTNLAEHAVDDAALNILAGKLSEAAGPTTSRFTFGRANAQEAAGNGS